MHTKGHQRTVQENKNLHVKAFIKTTKYNSLQLSNDYTFSQLKIVVQN